MTKIVIDTNIAFSALLNVDSRIGQILLTGHKYYDFYAPEYLKFELLKHKDKLKDIAKLSDDAFIELYELIIHHITILNHTVIPQELYQKSEELCKAIDIDDIVFVAVTEFTRGKLWTGDLTLQNGLAKKGYKRLIRTEDLYRDFISKGKFRQ